MWKKIKWQDLYDMIDKDIEYDDEDLKMLEEMKTSTFTVIDDKKEIDKYVQAAKEYKEAKKLISIRLANRDIIKVKKMAEEEWIPYQTLISAIIHKVANWKIELTFKE